MKYYFLRKALLEKINSYYVLDSLNLELSLTVLMTSSHDSNSPVPDCIQ